MMRPGDKVIAQMTTAEYKSFVEKGIFPERLNEARKAAIKEMRKLKIPAQDSQS